MAHFIMVESWMLSTGTALPQALRRRGHRYTLFCRDPGRYRHFRLTGGPHPAADLAAAVVTVDTNDTSAVIAAARELADRVGVDGVVTCCDYFLVTSAEVAAALGLPGPEPTAVATANDKARMRAATAAAGLPGPQYAVARDLDALPGAVAQCGFPVIAKPVDQCSGRGVRRLDNADDVAAFRSELVRFNHNMFDQSRDPRVLVEAVLEGPEYSVETVSNHGRTRLVGITDKRLGAPPACVEIGHMFPADITPAERDAMAAHVEQALQAVGYDHGTAHTEVRLTVDGPRIVEINTRVAGNWISELIRTVTGDDLLEAMAELALGRDWQPSVAADALSGSAAIHFAIPEQNGVISAATDSSVWAHDPAVLWSIIRPGLVGREVTRARDNDTYLAAVACVDHGGRDAGRRAAEHIARFRIEYGESAAPPSAATPEHAPS